MALIGSASTQAGDYPRPQLVRDSWLNLDGEWGFAYDDGDVGTRDGWYRPDQGAVFDRSIVVPFPPESVASGIGDKGFHPVVWYRRELTEASLRGPTPTGFRVLVHFGAVDYEADIWFDGIHVAHHLGGQTPFAVDVTSQLATGKEPHVLAVRAKDDPTDQSQPRGKQDWELEPHGIWYERTTGIWQTVWAEVVPAQRITEIVWIPRLADNSVSLELTLSQPAQSPMTLGVLLRLEDEVLAQLSTTAVGSRMTIEIPLAVLANPRRRTQLLWSPEQPTLIDAHLWLDHDETSGDNQTTRVDEVSSYLGLRSTEVGDGRFRLNGRPYYVRAVLAQGYWADTHLAAPDVEALRAEVELIKALGFNTVRLHQKVEDPRFLLAADTLGLLVWGETANAREFSSDSMERLTKEWIDVVRRDRSHPSIVTWVPLNESWGVDDIANDTAQQQFAAGLAALTRGLDPTRPVISNDGWEHVDSDILGVHDYTSRPGDIAERYRDEQAVLATLDGAGPLNRRLVLAESQRSVYLAGRAPLMVTEFGGISYAGQDTWGYSTVESDEEYEAALRAQFGAVQSCPPVAGFCFTQLSDTRQEANGLTTADRKPKLPIEVIAEIVGAPVVVPPRQSRAARWAKAQYRHARVRLRPVKGFALRLRSRLRRS